MSSALHAPRATLTPVSFHISAAMVERFARLSGDRSSLHVDAAFARRSQYRDNVVHGCLPLLFLSTLRVDSALRGRFGFQRLGASFLKPVYVGDTLVLAITDVSVAGDARRAEVEFSITHSESGTEVTRGSTVLERIDAAPPALPDRADGGADGATLLAAPLAERTHAFEQITKGDTSEFVCVPTRACLRSLFDILTMGSPPGSLEWGSWAEACDAANLLSASLFSPMVGMCQPGRAATFVNFDVTFTKPLEFDRVHQCRGVVAFTSATTQTISETISLTEDSGGGVQATGTAHVLINPPPPTMASLAELKEAALDLHLRGKVVLITGGSRGIGETTAKLFALHGAHVAINYLQSRPEAERIVKEITEQGGAALSVQADVTDRAQVRKMVRSICDHFGTIDVLVNNAVRDFHPTPFLELTWTRLQQDLDVVLKGAFNCCQEVLPLMVRQKAGKIINLSSVAVEIPPLHHAKYVIAKSALVGLSRSLAVEFAKHNIQVNLVVPSLVETDLTQHMGRIAVERVKSETPMNRLATPVEVARAVIFLASSLSSFTTGQKVVVTGGSAPLL